MSSQPAAFSKGATFPPESARGLPRTLFFRAVYAVIALLFSTIGPWHPVRSWQRSPFFNSGRIQSHRTAELPSKNL